MLSANVCGATKLMLPNSFPFPLSISHYSHFGTRLAMPGMKNTNIFIVFKLNGTWKIFSAILSKYVCVCVAAATAAAAFFRVGAHLLAV